MRGILILFTLTGSLLFAVGAKAQLANVTLGWSPSPSQNVSSYLIYYGLSSGNYTSAVPVSANATNVTIKGLISGDTYYFAATAVDSSGNQSAFSPEISGVAGPSGLVAASLTSAVAAKNGQFSFTITGLAGSKYAVQASTDLVNWVTIQTNVSPFSFVDPNASQFSRRYYRTAYISN